MTRPITQIHHTSTGTDEIREMNDDEYAVYQQNIATSGQAPGQTEETPTE